MLKRRRLKSSKRYCGNHVVVEWRWGIHQKLKTVSVVVELYLFAGVCIFLVFHSVHVFYDRIIRITSQSHLWLRILQEILSPASSFSSLNNDFVPSSFLLFLSLPKLLLLSNLWHRHINHSSLPPPPLLSSRWFLSVPFLMHWRKQWFQLASANYLSAPENRGSVRPKHQWGP